MVAPQAISGTHTLIATSWTGGITATVPLTIVPYVIDAPSAGAAGSTARVVGAGFAAGETVLLWWDNPAALLGTATANSVGTFGPITITVPAVGGALGRHAIVLADQTTGAFLGWVIFTVH
jgi:hypothetical protein